MKESFMYENFIENDMDLLEATELMNIFNEEYIYIYRRRII